MSAKTHGQSDTKLYKVWSSMKQRCSNPKDKAFIDYGGRGITFHEYWRTFEPFRKWALATGYRAGLTLERIDHGGNYEPHNCCWIPKAEQSANTRRCTLLTYKGETMILRDWAERLGLPYSLLQHRIYRGWSVERAFETPPISQNRRHVALYSYGGETKSIAEWARCLGLTYGQLYGRLYRGQTIGQVKREIQETTGKPVMVA